MTKKEIAKRLQEITKELFILMFELMREDSKEKNQEIDTNKQSLPNKEKLNKLN